MARRPVEPDPSTWWERYGYRVEPRADPETAPQPEPAAPEPAAPEPADTDFPDTEFADTDFPDTEFADPDLADPDGVGAPEVGMSDSPGATASELAGDAILRDRPDVPAAGWRRAVLRISGGVLNPGPGPAELRRRELLHRIRRPLTHAHHIAVTSIKGGVGKTTVAGLLGLVLAENRGDRVVVLDANPDAGTLADRLTGDSAVTVRELLRDLDRLDTWNEVSRYTSLAGRLQVLASEQDPAAGDAFSRDEYEHVCRLLDRFFDVVITDSGTGLVHSAMAGTLELAHSAIIVGAPTVDGSGRASKTLDLLHAHGYGALAEEAVTVLSCDRRSPEVDLARIRDHFAARCRAVVELPHDPHLATGGRMELARLRPATLEAAHELAALMADRFAP